MAYRDIALAYAKHLDPDLHAWLQHTLADEESRDPQLVHEGHTIGCKGDMLSLTSMWVARGRPENRNPTEWLRLPETKRLLAELDREQSNTGLSRIWIHSGRGKNGGTWAHKDIALAYAAYLSRSFHLWVLRVALKAIEFKGPPTESRAKPMGSIFAEELAKVQHAIVERINESDEREDRNAIDVMFLVSSLKEILFGKRMEFTASSREIIRQVTADRYQGRCPCCAQNLVLDATGAVLPGAEFDHHLGNRFNRPEFGWLICKPCHDEFTLGGHTVRLNKRNEILLHRDAVLAFKRQRRVERKLQQAA